MKAGDKMHPPMRLSLLDAADGDIESAGFGSKTYQVCAQN